MKMGELMKNKLRGISIPDNWSTIPLYEVRDKSERYSFTGGPFGSDLKSNDYRDEGVQIIQLQNIGDGYFENNYRIYTSEEKADSLASCNIFPGEIIIAKMAEPLARACKIPNHAVRFLMASDGIRLKVDTNKFDNDFILYSINSKYFRNDAISKGSGSTRLRIGLSELKKIEIFYPPLEEQKKIAKILLTWDKAIELKEKLIEQKKEQKKGLVQKLLSGKVRLPGFEKMWRRVILSEVTIGKGKYGINAPSVEKRPELPTYLRITDISNEGYVQKDGLQSVNHPDSNNYFLEENDIVFARTGASTGRTYLYDKADGRLVFAGFLIKFSLNPKKVNPKYISYCMQTEYYRNWVKVMSMRSGQPGINAEEYGQLQLNLPSLKEQEEISNLLSCIDNEILLLTREVDMLVKQKQALMQQLLTGKIRVKI